MDKNQKKSKAAKDEKDNFMRTNIMLDEDSHKVIGELPKRISASKLMRWMLKAVHTNDKEWKNLLRNDREIKEVQDWIRPRIMKVLGINEDQKKKILKIIDGDKSEQDEKE